MQLIDDEVENTALMLEPLPRLFKYGAVFLAHHHDAQHRVVRDQDVGRSILHVPPGPHLRPVEARKEVKDGGVLCFGGMLLGDPRASAAASTSSRRRKFLARSGLRSSRLLGARSSCPATGVDEL